MRVPYYVLRYAGARLPWMVCSIYMLNSIEDATCYMLRTLYTTLLRSIKKGLYTIYTLYAKQPLALGLGLK